MLGVARLALLGTTRLWTSGSSSCERTTRMQNEGRDKMDEEYTASLWRFSS